MNNEIAFFKDMARKDLLSFCVYSDKFFEIHKIHEVLGEALQRFMEGKTRKLILQTPPRSGKSRMVQESIAWAFGNLKNTEIIYTGHSVGLLEGFSRSIRERIGTIEYKSLFHSKVRADNGAVNDWSTDNGNRLMIYGVGGGITGRGGHRLIIDDPYATRQDAESDTIRKRVEDWYDSTFLSRRHNENAGLCLIMQRWREDDLVGYILSKESDWEVISVPAISDDGESFWSSRFSVDYLESVRKNIGDYFFQSQYQQQPFLDGSGTFQREYFRYYTELPKFNRIYTFVDPAISIKQEADYSAIVTIGITPQNDTYVLDIFRERVEPDELISNIIRIAGKFNPSAIGIEVVQFQKMLVLELKKQMRLLNKMWFIHEMRPSGEKEARIRSTLQPRYSMGAIFHNKLVLNTDDFELELIKFPNGKNDDMIDAMASAVAMANIELPDDEFIKEPERDPILDEDLPSGDDDDPY